MLSTPTNLLPLLLPVGVAEAEAWPFPAVSDARATELNGELVPLWRPKSVPVLDTGLELVEDAPPVSVEEVDKAAEAEEAYPPVLRGVALALRACAGMKATRSAWRVRIRRRILSDSANLFSVLNRKILSKKFSVRVLFPERNRMSNLTARRRYATFAICTQRR